MGQLLTDNGFQVTVANNGERGIAIARKMVPDIILLDIMMPDINGYEVCRRLKSDDLTMSIPVIFLTAKTDQEDLIKGFEAGAVDYITKPFVKDELLARVGAHSELSIKRSQELMLAGLLDKYVLEVIIDMDGTIRFVSAAFLDLTGYTTEDLIGKSFKVLKHPDTFRSELSDILESVNNNFTYYKEIKNKDQRREALHTESVCRACQLHQWTGDRCSMFPDRYNKQERARKAFDNG